MGGSELLAARVRLVGAAALFSTGGAAIKSCDLTGVQVACFRSAVAALALALVLRPAWRNVRWRDVAIAAAYATTMILFVLANKLTTAINTIFLQSTAPLHVMLLAPLLLAEPVRRRDVAFMAALAAGLALFFVGRQDAIASAPRPMAGNLLAVGSGVAWALTVVGLRWLARDGDGRGGSTAPALVLGNVLACLACLPFALPVVGSDTMDWLVIAWLGVFQIGAAYALLGAGMRHVPAFEAALLLLVEPVLNPLWAWWIHGETPTAWALGGCLLILAATASRTWVEARSAGIPAG